MLTRSHINLAWLAALWTLALLTVTSDVGAPALWSSLALIVTGVFIATAWLVQVGMALGGGGRRAERRAAAALLTCEALAAVAGIVAYSRDIPFRLRFSASEPALRAYARGEARGGRAGLFAIRAVSTSGGVTLLESGDWFLDRGGFAYSPGGAPRESHATTFQRIDGPWYRWRARL